MKVFLSAMAAPLILAVPVSSLSANRSATDDIEAVARLTRRVVPSVAETIRYELIPAQCDTFAVTADNGSVVIKGNNAISMAVGLNNYLRRDLGVSVSWFADDSVQVPDVIVLPSAG